MSSYYWSDGQHNGHFLYGGGDEYLPPASLFGDEHFYWSDGSHFGWYIFGNGKTSTFPSINTDIPPVNNTKRFLLVDDVFNGSKEYPYIDLLIENDDIAIDEFGIPFGIYGRDSIAQDIKHMIRESGYLVQMIAERSPQNKADLVLKIILLVEQDERLIPGTVKMVAAGSASPGEWFLTAKTYEFSSIEVFI